MANVLRLHSAVALEKRKNWPVWLMFFFLLTAHVLPPIAQTVLMGSFLAGAAVLWAFSKNKMPLYMVTIVFPFVLLVMIGLLGLINNKAIDVLKDGWYVANPLLTILTGFILAYNLKDFRRMARVFILVGVVISLMHLLRFAMNPELLTTSTNELRTMAGRGHLISVLAITLLVVSWKLKEYYFFGKRWLDVIFFIICFSSFVLSFSRELTLSLVLFMLCLFGFIDFTNKKRTIKMVLASLLMIGLVFALPKPQYAGAQSTFMDKVLYSVQELTVKDYRSIKDINVNWRGYETSRALATYEKGEYWQYFVGQGFGSYIDLGLFMPLGEERIRYAPVLHNGYMYLLVKTGILGILLYLGLLFSYLKISNRMMNTSNASQLVVGRLIAGSVCVVLVSTFVVAGLLNKTVLIPVALLLGVLLAHASSSQEQAKT